MKGERISEKLQSPMVPTDSRRAWFNKVGAWSRAALRSGAQDAWSVETTSRTAPDGRHLTVTVNFRGRHPLASDRLYIRHDLPSSEARRLSENLYQSVLLMDASRTQTLPLKRARPVSVPYASVLAKSHIPASALKQFAVSKLSIETLHLSGDAHEVAIDLLGRPATPSLLQCFAAQAPSELEWLEDVDPTWHDHLGARKIQAFALGEHCSNVEDVAELCARQSSAGAIINLEPARLGVVGTVCAARLATDAGARVALHGQLPRAAALIAKILPVPVLVEVNLPYLQERARVGGLDGLGQRISAYLTAETVNGAWA